MVETKKILVRGTNWVGDAVMTIPALRELRRIFTHAEITLHTRPWARGIFEDADFIDEILTFEKSRSNIKNVLTESKVIRAKQFDLAVLFTNSFETALVAKLGNVKKRFGYGKEARSFLLSNAVEIPEWKNERHEVFYYLNLVAEIEKAMLGTETVLSSEPEIDLQVSAKRKLRAREILREAGVDSTKLLVALGVGSTNSRAKRWHADGYAELNDKLQAELDAAVILIGASDETDVAAEVFQKSKNKPFILTGKTTVSEAVAILSETNLLVSNDMGLAHISSAVGTRTLVLFGPTNPHTTKPWNAEIVYKKVECSPCMLRDCPIDHRCLARISAEEVFTRVKAQIAAN